MRLIDADALCAGLVSNHPVVIYAKSEPTVDAVPVVRCKDCKHGMYDVMCKFYWCHGIAHSANWFCADAERREDE